MKKLQKWLGNFSLWGNRVQSQVHKYLLHYFFIFSPLWNHGMLVWNNSRKSLFDLLLSLWAHFWPPSLVLLVRKTRKTNNTNQELASLRKTHGIFLCSRDKVTVVAKILWCKKKICPYIWSIKIIKIELFWNASRPSELQGIRHIRMYTFFYHKNDGEKYLKSKTEPQ